MKPELLNPKQSLSLAHRRLRPHRQELELFRLNLKEMLERVDGTKREDNQKNIVRDFLLNTYYKKDYEVNSKGDEDLVIHLGKTSAEKVGVIIETKRPGNKTEMPTRDNLNCKALQELVLYYMRERVNEENIDLKYLIITNVYEWYIIEAAWFEKSFYRNASFLKEFKEWSEGKKVTPDTELFYKAIAKPFIDKLEEKAPCTYFDIRNYEDALKDSEDRRIIALFKLLSPNHLLKTKFEDDSNKLDERFYKELLHVIGLEEAKEGSKFIIRRKAQNRNAGSLLENAISLLQTEGLGKVRDLAQYGSEAEEQVFNVALELCITWVNRILFLKLFEAQLVNYHNGNKDYRFLHTETIPDFNELFKLFHKVLAVDIHKRDAALKKKYSLIPYLNSSLFEISPLEDVTIKINSLDTSLQLELLNSTILKEEVRRSKEPALPTLEYLFKFLNAYDFASESTEEIQEEKKTIINASVLGKVFEKINGYKDGSVFTPGFITMYMCRQAIRQAVLQKFKEKYKWEVEEFDELKSYLKDHRNRKDILLYNELINSLHICDPAVGSGHFLVSALNEMICIKSELGILADKDGIRLNCDVSIDNDELSIMVDKGEGQDFFEYKVVNGEINEKAQRIQITLFQEKQTIIENCLFGVDINPKSVLICRLRLWIELLKNAYYRDIVNYTDLDTLPNIDINIKCGNSLISRFPLDADLTKALKSIKYNIETYRGYVNEYKNAKDREYKRGLEKLIDDIKSNFRTEIGRNDPKYNKLQKLQYELNILVAPNMFKEDDEPDYGNRSYKKEKEEKRKYLEAEIERLTSELNEVKNNAIYRHALEWRFEFPEVLNNNGDFEGFDIVIGNPPYIRQEQLGVLKEYLKSNYEVYNGTGDIFSYFYEKGHNILKENGVFCFITNSYDKITAGKSLREFILKKFCILTYLDFKNVSIFNDVTTYPVILSAIKQGSSSLFKYLKIYSVDLKGLESLYNPSKYININQKNLVSRVWNFSADDENTLLNKISSHRNLRESFEKCFYGIKTGLNKAFLINEEQRIAIIQNNKNSERIIKPFLEGKDIKKWCTKDLDKYVIFTRRGITIEEYPSVLEYLSQWKTELTPKKSAEDKKGRKPGSYKWYEIQDSVDYYRLFESPKITWTNLQKSNKFSFDEDGRYINAPSVILPINNKYVLAVLNSKVVWYFLKSVCVIRNGGYIEAKPQYIEQIPIPEISAKEQQPFIALVDKIISGKKAGADTTALEAEIDQMVYKLYGLTDEEIKIIEHE